MFGILDYLKMGAGIAAGILLYHLYAVTIGYPSAVREARQGYVLQSEKTTAESERDEFKRQAESYKTVMDAYQIQYRNQLQKEQQDDAQAEQERKDHAAKNHAEGHDDGLTNDDIRFLRRRP